MREGAASSIGVLAGAQALIHPDTVALYNELLLEKNGK